MSVCGRCLIQCVVVESNRFVVSFTQELTDACAVLLDIIPPGGTIIDVSTTVNTIAAMKVTEIKTLISDHCDGLIYKGTRLEMAQRIVEFDGFNAEDAGVESSSPEVQLRNSIRSCWFHSARATRHMQKGNANESAVQDLLEGHLVARGIELHSIRNVGLCANTTVQGLNVSPDGILCCGMHNKDFLCALEIKTRDTVATQNHREEARMALETKRYYTVDLGTQAGIDEFRTLVVNQANQLQVLHAASALGLEHVLFVEATPIPSIIYSVLITIPAVIRASEFYFWTSTSSNLNPLGSILMTCLFSVCFRVEFLGRVCHSIRHPVLENGGGPNARFSTNVKTEESANIGGVRYECGTCGR